VAARERFVSNAGLRIRYLDNEPAVPHGQPLVFVPGITDFADEYEAVFDVFGRRRLLVIELRGRGGSDAPMSGYSVAEQAGDVEAVIAANHLERFHLMTFSRGTTPALEVALRSPGRVVTLSIGDYLATEVALTPQFVESLWNSRWRGMEMADRIPRHVIEGIQGDSRGRELWQDVGALDIPVLVAHGADGGILDDGHLDRYRTAIADLEVVVIDGAGHDLFRPDRTAYPVAVLDFIARRAPGR
jgi:pimeloyl-ACP methyl ester carboxylesterase